MKLKNILATTLIPFNSLLLFFLVFEDKLVVPSWLQVMGRLHPVVLHFPIVLVLIYAAAILVTPKSVRKEKWFINLGEWINHNTYAVFDGDELELKTWQA